MIAADEKCVIVLKEGLAAGLAANAAAILGITLGKQCPEIVGADVCDRTGVEHLGIVEFPVPILRADAQGLRQIREKAQEKGYEDVITVDFSHLAQGCKTYEEYEAKMAETEEVALCYDGVALLGARKKVNRLTGNLPLMR